MTANALKFHFSPMTCDKRFPRLYELRKHIAIIHEGKQMENILLVRYVMNNPFMLHTLCHKSEKTVKSLKNHECIAQV